MPRGKTPGPSIKNPRMYEAVKKRLKARGMTEDAAQERAARISNAYKSKKKRKADRASSDRQ